MPPAAVRRPLTITAWVAMSVVCLALSPLLLVFAAVASRLMRRPQPLLLARLVISYFAHELVVLVACGALWLLSGFGLLMRRPAIQQLHYRLLRWFVHGLARRATSLLSVRVEVRASDQVLAALAADRPLLFFSRHAGPGDTVLLVDSLLERFDRRPSVVFKDTLTIDPCIDLIGHRLPHAVLDQSAPEECELLIERVSHLLKPRGVLMLFPEGGNFTPERRRGAIRRLRRKGLTRQARSAQQMEHVLPPHPGGAVAALRGNRDADVLFAAHTGLGLAAFPRELWRHTPIGETLIAKMWIEPSSQRPVDADAQEEWLYSWWKRIDEWVEQQGEE